MSQAQKAAETSEPRKIGRFEMHGKIASGGFAAIHIGRTAGGAGGFAKSVAIKRLHGQFVSDSDVTGMFLDEARVVARIQHPNVVPILDFVEQDGELFMVMEYIEGVTLGHILHDLGQRKQRLPLDVALGIVTGALRGLHAAHEARDEQGQAMCVIHRDVSPDNMLVGVDGFARILDFGVARAMGQYHATRDGHVKGKLFYMTPEQVMGLPLSRRADIFSASVVLWQCLTGRLLFSGQHMAELALKVTQQPIVAPSTFNSALSEALDRVVLKGLERNPELRWETADQMAEELESVATVGSPSRVGRWLKQNAEKRLKSSKQHLASVQLTPSDLHNAPDSQRLAEASEGADGSQGDATYKAATTVVVKRRDPSQDDEPTGVLDVAEMRRAKRANHTLDEASTATQIVIHHRAKKSRRAKTIPSSMGLRAGNFPPHHQFEGNDHTVPLGTVAPEELEARIARANAAPASDRAARAAMAAASKSEDSVTRPHLGDHKAPALPPPPDPNTSPVPSTPRAAVSGPGLTASGSLPGAMPDFSGPLPAVRRRDPKLFVAAGGAALVVVLGLALAFSGDSEESAAARSKAGATAAAVATGAPTAAPSAATVVAEADSDEGSADEGSADDGSDDPAPDSAPDEAGPDDEPPEEALAEAKPKPETTAPPRARAAAAPPSPRVAKPVKRARPPAKKSSSVDSLLGRE
jgi:serine/threonine-protein kinase